VFHAVLLKDASLVHREHDEGRHAHFPQSDIFVVFCRDGVPYLTDARVLDAVKGSDLIDRFNARHEGHLVVCYHDLGQAFVILKLAHFCQAGLNHFLAVPHELTVLDQSHVDESDAECLQVKEHVVGADYAELVLLLLVHVVQVRVECQSHFCIRLES